MVFFKKKFWGIIQKLIYKVVVVFWEGSELAKIEMAPT